MALKNIPDPGFADDDGTADPALTAALGAWQSASAGSPQQAEAEQRVRTALDTARLLVPVVAVLGEAETGADGLRRDKTSDMAVPTLTAPGGRKALPAFTSTEALSRWRADARPVAVPVQQALQALAHEEADTLVLDLAGPVTYQLTGPALHALAAGRSDPNPVTDPAVQHALRVLLAAEPQVTGAHLAPGDAEADATLALTLAPDTGADAARSAAQRLAVALAADETLCARLSRGLSLALLPAGTQLPAHALYSGHSG